MWLLIDVAGADRPHWEGFDFVVNRHVTSSTETILEICTGDWQWQSVATLPYRVEGTQVHVAIPRESLGIDGEEFSLGFKWLDNTQNPGDILDAYIHGDAAPGGRFRYRYSSD
jgi:hypothetical protein